eukprot:13009858-Ditylum_brightwellii.AAC.1
MISTASEIFEPNFYVSSPTSCGTDVLPGLAAAKDLRLSELIVGQTYEFCVRAGSTPIYMPQLEYPSSDSLASSSNTCVTHRIKWEASINGRIITEPSAGSLPIEDVT